MYCSVRPEPEVEVVQAGLPPTDWKVASAGNEPVLTVMADG